MGIINKRRVKKDSGISKDEIIIDKMDCLQRDFASFKPFLMSYIDQKIDRAVEEIRKRKPHVEVGYR